MDQSIVYFSNRFTTYQMSTSYPPLGTVIQSTSLYLYTVINVQRHFVM